MIGQNAALVIAFVGLVSLGSAYGMLPELDLSNEQVDETSDFTITPQAVSNVSYDSDANHFTTYQTWDNTSNTPSASMAEMSFEVSRSDKGTDDKVFEVDFSDLEDVTVEDDNGDEVEVYDITSSDRVNAEISVGGTTSTETRNVATEAAETVNVDVTLNFNDEAIQYLDEWPNSPSGQDEDINYETDEASFTVAGQEYSHSQVLETVTN